MWPKFVPYPLINARLLHNVSLFNVGSLQSPVSPANIYSLQGVCVMSRCLFMSCFPFSWSKFVGCFGCFMSCCPFSWSKSGCLPCFVCFLATPQNSRTQCSETPPDPNSPKLARVLRDSPRFVQGFCRTPCRTGSSTARRAWASLRFASLRRKLLIGGFRHLAVVRIGSHFLTSEKHYFCWGNMGYMSVKD